LSWELPLVLSSLVLRWMLTLVRLRVLLLHTLLDQSRRALLCQVGILVVCTGVGGTVDCLSLGVVRVGIASL
jgi:membrane-anchored glycerophosphoryl diester phosphodiesterase (GDPDase)